MAGLQADMNQPTLAQAPRSAARAGIAGLIAAAAALAAGELAGALAAPRPGPVIAVANKVIDYAPTWFVQFGKDVFGLADKPALIAGTIVISMVLGVAFGLASRRDPQRGVIGIVGFGIIGLFAMASDPQGGPISAVLIAIVAVVAGVATLLPLLGLAVFNRIATDPDTLLANTPLTNTPLTNTPLNDTDNNALQTQANVVPVPRRAFLGWAGTAAAVAAGAGIGSKALRGRSAAAGARAAVTLPLTGETASAAAEIDAAVKAAAAHPVGQVSGISSLITPNDDFYLIDTALLVPQVDPADWKLTIRGLVDREVTYTYQELLDRAQTVAPVTLSCVSNEIGGGLVGNAVWQGVPLSELLDEAGIQPGATQIRSASVDGWDCGFPTEAAYDGRTALVAVAMNGEPLPLAHGFPVRLVVAGLYGYVSATKWLQEIELTTLEDFDGYWIPRGWAKDAPVKTQSRIDTPRSGSQVAAGVEVPIAGVAWAPNIGIEKVEVQVDDGPWQEAELGDSLGANAWRQWYLPWMPVGGQHEVRVRATDGSGVTQTETRTQPAPDGASGWHRITVNV